MARSASPKSTDDRPSTAPSRHAAAAAAATASSDGAASTSQAGAPVPASRYRHDFQEAEPLGRGSFGQVVKARNRLDGQVYAIKKIPLKRPPRHMAGTARVLREVQVLSRLSHANVVRYYQAWIEPVTPEEAAHAFKPRMQPSLLFIQMEFCPRQTLKDRLEEGLAREETWRFFRQILQGLAYVHSFGLIHRDLSPKNLFIADNGNVKLGDFGLATSQRRPPVSGAASESISHAAMTRQVGTPFYVAPELMAPQSAHAAGYSHKVDLYSLGIILFEMAYPFSTGMERAIVLRSLREPTCRFPDDFDQKALRGPAIILQLISHDAEKRPDCEVLLTSSELPMAMEDQVMTE
ncbi:hypothetical protein CXG81DRAFT_11040, partial [Caulochytrium protostelioides]